MDKRILDVLMNLVIVFGFLMIYRGLNLIWPPLGYLFTGVSALYLAYRYYNVRR